MNELENVNNINIDDLYNRIVALIENAKRNVATKVNDEMTLLYGDAVYETSSKGDGSQSGWHKDYSTFPNLPVPNFIRGGYCFYGVGGGLFCFFPHWSGTVSSSTFRVVAI